MSNTTPTESERNAILRVASYHRKDYDMAVVWFPPRVHAPVESSLRAAPRQPQHPLGDLDKLPQELVDFICLELDIASVFNLRHVNRRAQEVVAAIPEYEFLTTHALGAMCALLRTKAASNGSFADLYQLVCAQICTACESNYGDLMNLITWKRFCFKCLRGYHPQTRIADANEVKRKLQITEDSFAALTRIVSVAGTYSLAQTPRSESNHLVYCPAVLAVQDESDWTATWRLNGQKRDREIHCTATLRAYGEAN